MNREKIIDVIGGLVSLLFIASVFYLYFFQVFHYNFTFDVNNDEMVTYEQEEHYSCHINIVEPTIVLRMDDVRAYSKQTPYLVDEIINRNLQITLGVIPNHLGEDRSMQGYLTKISKNPNIEIAQHGTYHDESDMDMSREDLAKGKLEIQRYIGVDPVTYIPPYNRITPEALEVIAKRFRVISGGQGMLKEGDIAQIGYTVNTYSYLNKQPIPTEKIISDCKTSLEKTNLCVITIHPQEYSTDINHPTDINEGKLEEFNRLLDGLQGLDAKFSTFNELVFCKP